MKMQSNASDAAIGRSLGWNHGCWRVQGIEPHNAHYREFPHTGMSCAIFETPPSRRITVMSGSQRPGWPTDNYPDDQHYSFRTLRTTIRLPDGD